MRVRRSRAILVLALTFILGFATLYLLYDYGLFAEPDKSILCPGAILVVSVQSHGRQDVPGTPNTGEGGQLYIRDGVVYLMYKTPEINLTLGQVVSKYGPPEKVATYIGQMEKLVYSFFLYYPSKGLIFGSLTPIEPGREKASVTEDWRVTWIRYFAPTTLEGYLEVTQPDRPDHHAYVLRSVEDWQGFGVYDFGSD